MIQMSVTQSQTLIRQILDPPWILWPSPKPSRTPSHHQAAKELAAVVTAAAVARRRRASKGLPAAATGLNQAQQSAALAVVVVAARAKRRRALPPHRPRVAAVRNHLRHRQRRTRTNIAVLVPQNTVPNLRARVAHLRRVARVAAVRAAVAVTRIKIKIRIRIARARASIAHRRAHQRANQKGALPLTADRVPRASRKTRRVVRNLPRLRVATSQSQRVVAVAASTHDIIDRGLGAAVDRQVM